MKTTHVLGSLALIATALASAALPLQDKPPVVGGDSAPGLAATIEAFRQAAVPSQPHQDFAQCVGTWTTHFKHWTDPSQPPQESEGTSSFETIMGGRFLVEHATGDGPMGPFEGMGLLAYNNLTREFEHVWLDDTRTGLMIARGIDGDGGTITLKGELVDPLTKDKRAVRVISTRVGEDERLLEMFCERDGLEQKSMEIRYTRGVGG